MNKIYYQCEHCIHFIQHYGISDEGLHEVNCGHCRKIKKTIDIRKRNCPHFEELTKEIEKEQKEERAVYVLKQVNKTLKQLKLYLYNQEQNQKVDDCLLERFKH